MQSTRCYASRVQLPIRHLRPGCPCGNSSATAKYRDFFAKHGIDVDDFAVEVTEGTHQRLIHRKGQNWTSVWKKWIDENPNATTKQVYQQAGRMMDDYGLSGLRIGPYR